MNLKLQTKLYSKKALDKAAQERGATKRFPISPGSGWPMQVQQIVKDTDKKERPHYRVIYRALEDLEGDFEMGDQGRDLFYVLPDPNVSQAWQDVHIEKLSRLAWACGKEGIDDLTHLVNCRVRLVVQFQQDNPKYTEVTQYLPYKDDLDPVPFD